MSQHCIKKHNKGILHLNGYVKLLVFGFTATQGLTRKLCQVMQGLHSVITTIRSKKIFDLSSCFTKEKNMLKKTKQKGKVKF